MEKLWLRRALCAAGMGACVVFGACGNNNNGPTGGPVSGAQDLHCRADGGITAQEVNQASCSGAGADGGVPAEEEAPVLFNAEGDDDDCKYHVSFTSTDVRKNEDVSFTVTVKELANSKAATGAEVNAEVFLDETHPAPNSGATTTESAGGVYKIGPIRFDASGRWTVRFHIHEECSDALEDSPHGHVAFFIDVP